MAGIPKYLIEVKDFIERVPGSNPLMNGVADGIPILGVVRRSAIGRERAAIHFDSMCVSSVDNLLQGLDDLTGCYRLTLEGARSNHSLCGMNRNFHGRPSDVVQPFQHDQSLGEWLGDHASIDQSSFGRTPPSLLLDREREQYLRF